jgi:hypothetical protein
MAPIFMRTPDRSGRFDRAWHGGTVRWHRSHDVPRRAHGARLTAATASNRPELGAGRNRRRWGTEARLLGSAQATPNESADEGRDRVKHRIGISTSTPYRIRFQKRPAWSGLAKQDTNQVIAAQKSAPTAAEAIAGARGSMSLAFPLPPKDILWCPAAPSSRRLRDLSGTALGVRPHASGEAVASHCVSDQLFRSFDLLSKVLERYLGVWCVARPDPKLAMSAAYRAFQAGRLSRAGCVARNQCASVEPEADGMSGRGTWL